MPDVASCVSAKCDDSEDFDFIIEVDAGTLDVSVELEGLVRDNVGCGDTVVLPVNNGEVAVVTPKLVKEVLSDWLSEAADCNVVIEELVCDKDCEFLDGFDTIDVRD